MTMTTNDRAKVIRKQAESQALKLIKSDLKSDDPKLGLLCKRLEKFSAVLKKNKNLPDDRVIALVRTGLDMVKFTPKPESTDEDEALRLLHGLADKLSGMTGLLGGFF